MLAELADIVTRYTAVKGGPGPFETEVEGLAILRSDQEKRPNHFIIKPALCVVVQGEKWTMFGSQRFEYGAGQALAVSVDMPAFGSITKASADKPFLGLVIQYDPGVMREVRESLIAPPSAKGVTGGGVRLTNFEGPIADCVLRMVRLLETPAAIPTIAPMIMRELCYWLLTGPEGGDISRFTFATSPSRRIASAMYRLRKDFARQLRVQDLAAVARLSPSAFHRQFKALTSMTPLQYQKQLRLLEARRLMMSGATNVETAARLVGYESPSQFSREYSRMFGAAPLRDTMSLRQAVA